jgi:hypothetical protein
MHPHSSLGPTPVPSVCRDSSAVINTWGDMSAVAPASTALSSSSAVHVSSYVRHARGACAWSTGVACARSRWLLRQARLAHRALLRACRVAEIFKDDDDGHVGSFQAAHEAAGLGFAAAGSGVSRAAFRTPSPRGAGAGGGLQATPGTAASGLRRVRGAGVWRMCFCVLRDVCVLRARRVGVCACSCVVPVCGAVRAATWMAWVPPGRALRAARRASLCHLAWLAAQLVFPRLSSVQRRSVPCGCGSTG